MIKKTAAAIGKFALAGLAGLAIMLGLGSGVASADNQHSVIRSADIGVVSTGVGEVRSADIGAVQASAAHVRSSDMVEAMGGVRVTDGNFTSPPVKAPTAWDQTIDGNTSAGSRALANSGGPGYLP